MGGVAAGWHRLRPQPAGRRAFRSARVRPFWHLSNGTAAPGRRVHGRLCRDLAGQRG